MIDRNQVHEGMLVRSSDGTKLGRVVACEDGRFVIEKGFYIARYDDVMETAGNEIRLSCPQDSLTHDEHDSPRKPWAQAEEEEEETSRSSRARRDRGEADRPGYKMGETAGSVPSSYGGDESGDGM